MNDALEEASWHLNEGGMKVFHQQIKAALRKIVDMTFEDGLITERYVGKRTRSYVGHYETDGVMCNCSWFQSRLLCRHPIAYRLNNGLPLFDLQMFHTVFRRISSSESLEEDDEDDNEEIDGEDSGEEDDLRRNPRMGSPGMEHLIREEQAANRRLKKK